MLAMGGDKMRKMLVLVFLTAIPVGTAMAGERGYANPAAGAIPANASDQGVQLVQIWSWLWYRHRPPSLPNHRRPWFRPGTAAGV
jgi:hypothetical protein